MQSFTPNGAGGFSPTTYFGTVLLSFVGDPLLFGLFVKKVKALEAQPILVYSRSALRVAALASVLPRRRTFFTDAGRSQLLAYLLHDALFAICAQVIVPSLLELAPTGFQLVHELPLGNVSVVSVEARAPPTTSLGLASASSTFAVIRVGLLAIGELALYASICIAVQLALSHPRLLRRTSQLLCPSLVAKCQKAASCASGALAVVRGNVRLLIIRRMRTALSRDRHASMS